MNHHRIKEVLFDSENADLDISEWTSLEAFIEWLQGFFDDEDITEKIKADVKVRFDCVLEPEYDNGWPTMEIFYWRTETDEECAAREKAAADLDVVTTLAERAEYERLKAKFGAGDE